jgi:hypothetical protein
MTSEELAKAITHHLESLENRIINVGSKEYSLGKTQKIETKTIDKLLDEAIEELDDLVVYLSFTRLKIQKLRSKLDLEVLAAISSDDQLG